MEGYIDLIRCNSCPLWYLSRDIVGLSPFSDQWGLPKRDRMKVFVSKHHSQKQNPACFPKDELTPKPVDT